eukprot:gnl/TRDRNA2_/TRDRNA2_127836_c0_seq1.p1 gnl/TRDRNA2_/TRDRNA2_127836_c0~~gnl/TRDRNA2_/TRDRNA2_127836_c0_seq1.p1  ORF type:complete len:531 (+),score=110.61 gnl/TRDRNA2_/TRDRNA2_127836_c0_seq1:37-1629(+)
MELQTRPPHRGSGAADSLDWRALEAERAELTEQLQLVEAEAAEAAAETEACVASLPSSQAMLRECIEGWRIAQSELAGFEGLIAEREANVERLECEAERLARCRTPISQVSPIGQVGASHQHELQLSWASSPCSDGSARVSSPLSTDRSWEHHARTHLWLRRRCEEAEEKQLATLQECQAVSRSAVKRLEGAHRMMRQDLERREEQARRLEEELKGGDAERAQQLDGTGRHEARQAERADLRGSVVRLENQLRELKANTGQLELSEEQVLRRHMSEEVAVSTLQAEAEEVQEAIDAAESRFHGVEAQISELAAADHGNASALEADRGLPERRLPAVATCREVPLQLPAMGSAVADAQRAAHRSGAFEEEVRKARAQLRAADEEAERVQEMLRGELRHLGEHQERFGATLHRLLGHASSMSSYPASPARSAMSPLGSPLQSPAAAPAARRMLSQLERPSPKPVPVPGRVGVASKDVRRNVLTYATVDDEMDAGATLASWSPASRAESRSPLAPGGAREQQQQRPRDAPLPV